MSADRTRVAGIYRYPVKGLSPQSLSRVQLSVGETLPADRIYAIENGPSGFDPAVPAFVSKTRFLMLMRHEKLAALRTYFDEASHGLTICVNGREVVRGSLRTPEGRDAVEQFVARYCAGELRGAPKVLCAPGHSFSDAARKVISIVNLGSVAAIERASGASVNPLRFRGNVYLFGWPAWQEFDLVGREIAIGPWARLKIVERIERCAATAVNPEIGISDLAIPRILARNFGHVTCGVYAEVVTGGAIAIGDAVKANGRKDQTAADRC